MSLMAGVKALFVRPRKYEMDRAVVVTFANLPPDSRQALDHEDIELILKLASRYLEEEAPPEAAAVAETKGEYPDEIFPYVREKAEQRSKQYKSEDIQSVLQAEKAYLRLEGFLKG